MKKSSLLSVVFLLLCGCNIIPPGTPPEGNIVDNQTVAEKQGYTVQEASDYLINSFVMTALSQCPGAEIKIASSGNTIAYNWAALVISQSGKISGNRVTCDDSPWMIKPEFDGNVIKLTLYHNDSVIWSESVKLNWQNK